MKTILWPIFIIGLWSCNSLFTITTQPIIIKGQLVDNFGQYPLEQVSIKVNGSKTLLLSDKAGYFTSANGRIGDNELTFYWQGKEISFLLIELKTPTTYDFGKIKLDVSIARPIFLSQTDSY